MNLHHLDGLLGHPGPDAGCDAAFAVMDEYAELQVGGGDAPARFPDVATHLRNCAACREDLEGLVAALTAGSTRSGER